MSTDDVLEPVVRTVTVRCGKGRAFAAFAQEIHEWWPSAFSASGDDLARVVIEGRPRGRVYETNSSGAEYGWGSVLTWEPDDRVVLVWTLAIRNGPATHVEVTFTEQEDSCLVRLEHGGWNAEHGDDRSRFDDDSGWVVVLKAFRTYADS